MPPLLEPSWQYGWGSFGVPQALRSMAWRSEFGPRGLRREASDETSIWKQIVMQAVNQPHCPQK